MTRSTGTSGLIFDGIAAERLHRVAHRREIDHGGNAGEILHQHARRTERDLAIGGLGLEPLRDALDVFLGDGAAVFVAQQIFQQHLHRERKPRNSAQPVLLRLGKAVIDVGLAADREGLGAFETVERGHGGLFHPIGAAGRRRARRQKAVPSSDGPATSGIAPPHATYRLIRAFSAACYMIGAPRRLCNSHILSRLPGLGRGHRRRGPEMLRLSASGLGCVRGSENGIHGLQLRVVLGRGAWR